MDAGSSKDNLKAFNEAAGAGIVADWLLAINCFHTHYHQLTTYANGEGPLFGLANGVAANRGQCPVARLRVLLTRMQEELENLWQDLELAQLTDQTNSGQKFKRLARHTRRLNKLNQQAQIMLLLATQSAT